MMLVIGNSENFHEAQLKDSDAAWHNHYHTCPMTEHALRR